MAPTLDSFPVEHMLDQRLSYPMSRISNEVVLVLKIAISCLTENPHSRPTMEQVANVLAMP